MRAHGYAVLALVAACLAGPASAAPCYVIFDRNDAIIFRDYSPPFDLSDPKGPERQMMRRQGQHMIIAEFDNCNPVGFISPITGATTATVDEIVLRIQPAVATSVARSSGVSSAVQPGSASGNRPY